MSSLDHAAKAVAILGTIALILGVTYNFALFLPFGLDWLLTLTIGDHLSTAATMLPVVLAAIGGAIFISYWMHEHLPTRFRGRRVYRPKRELLKDCLCIALIALSVMLGILADMPYVGLIVGMLSTLSLWQFTWLRLTKKFLIDRTSLQLGGLALGYAAIGLIVFALARSVTVLGYDPSLPGSAMPASITVENREAFSGIVVGVFDRGTFIIKKPGNERVYVTQKSALQFDEEATAHPSRDGRGKIRAEILTGANAFIDWLSRLGHRFGVAG